MLDLMSTSSAQHIGGGCQHEEEEGKTDDTTTTTNDQNGGSSSSITSPSVKRHDVSPRRPDRSPARRRTNRNKNQQTISTHSPPRIPRRDRIRSRPAAQSLSPPPPANRDDYQRGSHSLVDLSGLNHNDADDILLQEFESMRQHATVDTTDIRRNKSPKKTDRALRVPTKCTTNEDTQSEALRIRKQKKPPQSPQSNNNQPKIATTLDDCWPQRQLCRSVSVDDMMEYQRAFSKLGTIGRSTSSQSLFQNGRKRRKDQQTNDNKNCTDTNEPGSSSLHADNTPPRQPSSNQSSLDNNDEATTEINPGRKTQRKSFANSDLEEFKRMFQMDSMQKGRKDLMLGELRQQHSMEDRHDTAKAQQGQHNSNNTDSMDSPPPPGPPDDDDELIGTSAVAVPASSSPSAKLLRRKMMDAMQQSNTATSTNTKTPVSPIPQISESDPHYQWGTQSSVRKSILASDLTSFQQRASWKGGLDSLDASAQNQLTTEERAFMMDGDGPPKIPLESALQSTGVVSYPSRRSSNKDIVAGGWGTRSLRRFILASDHPPQYNNPLVRYPTGSLQEVLQEVDEDRWNEANSEKEEGYGSESNDIVVLGNLPQWEKDDLISSVPPPSQHPLFAPSMDVPDALVMPRRVVSAERIEREHSSRKKDGAPGMPHRSGGPPPTVFRRSISSSDLEKFQRQKNLDDSEEQLETKHEPPVAGDHNTDDSPADLETAPEPELDLQDLVGGGLSAVELHDSVSGDALFPLGRTLSSGASNDVPPKPRRRHRRSSSDDPMLHMDEIVPDVAPRKPKRTSSSHLANRKMVRFAVGETIIHQIPRVSEESKKKLFYTRRDVKKFRMNEHKRQEEQIREYMEYLNDKQEQLQNGIFE